MLQLNLKVSCMWCDMGKFHPVHAVPHVAWITDATGLKIRVEWW